jgi:glycosyltransferase involved in cell wall biosynthesis
VFWRTSDERTPLDDCDTESQECIAVSNWPRITIVTPSFNQGRYLEETICSVLAENYPNLEYIIIDGGSTDDSVEIIKRYQSRLAFWVSESDRGQAHALNKGFDRGTGEICGFLNSDDLYRPGALFRVAQAYRSSSRPARFWHAFAVEEFDANGTRTVVRPTLQQRLANWVDWVDNRASLHQPGVFWARELHEIVGGFDADLQFAFDRKFFAAAMLKGYRLTVEREFIAARFRYHDQSKTVIMHEDGKLGFAPEFSEISRWIRQQASLPQRLEIVFGRLGRRQQAVGEDLMLRNSPHRTTRLSELLLAVALYPPLARRRFFWGAIRKVARGRDSRSA